MVEIDLTGEEREIVQQVLEDTLSDLRMEIADTDLYDYRMMLKQRKAAIVKVLDAFKTDSPDE